MIDEKIVTRASPSPKTYNVDQFLAPMCFEEFMAVTWGKSHVHIQRIDPEYYQSLFRLEDFDRCLTVAKGQAAVGMSLIGALGSERKTVEGAVSDLFHDKAYERFCLGDTIRILGIEKLWPPVAELCLDLNERFGAKTHANGYLTPASAQGFDTHFDYHDAFILQVSGTKEWFIYEPEHALPVDLPFAKVWPAGPSDPASLVLREHCTLQAGDLLYVPRGFYHRALTSHSHSLHLTVSLDPLYWYSVLQRALELACVARPEFREAITPGALNEPDLAVATKQKFQQMLALFVDCADFDQTALRLEIDRFAAAAPPPDGHFADLVLLGSLTADTLVIRRSGLPVRVDTRDRVAFIQFGSHQIEGPLALITAFDHVRSHRRFRVCELPDSLSPESKLMLVRRLIQEGLLRIEND